MQNTQAVEMSWLSQNRRTSLLCTVRVFTEKELVICRTFSHLKRPKEVFRLFWRGFPGHDMAGKEVLEPRMWKITADGLQIKSNIQYKIT